VAYVGEVFTALDFQIGGNLGYRMKNKMRKQLRCLSRVAWMNKF
jgi:hypothetical protein